MKKLFIRKKKFTNAVFMGDAFADRYLIKDGDTIADAKNQLKKEQKKQQGFSQKLMEISVYL